MKISVTLPIILLSFFLLSGCAASSGFDRGSLHSQMNDSVIISDKDIEKTLELKPQLQSPFRLAVYFTSQRYYSSAEWRWDNKDKEQILALGQELKSKNIISDMIILPNSITNEINLKDIRLAAARAGADAVLIIKGAGAVDAANNYLAPTYLLLVTTMFVPGTDLSALFIADATMWDVRNQYLYLSVEAEGNSKVSVPPYSKREPVVSTAKTEALSAVTKDLGIRLTNMK